MHKQRIVLASLAGVGVLTVFLPWVEIMGLIGINGLDVAQGWVVLVLFAVALGVAFTGARPYALDGARQGMLSVLGLGAAGFGVWKLLQIKDGTIQLTGEMGQQMQQQMHRHDENAELGKSMAKGFTKMLGGGDELLGVGYGMYVVIAIGVLIIAVAWWKKRAA